MHTCCKTALAVQISPAQASWPRHLNPVLACVCRCKKYTETDYFFLELFADQSAIEFHGGGDTFAAMSKRQKEARANDRSRKAKFTMGVHSERHNLPIGIQQT